MKVLLLHRAEEFSPNNVEKDASLLDAIEKKLKEGGHQTLHVREECLSVKDLDGIEAVISMARRFKTLMLLEKQRVRTINSPLGVRNALSREMTLDLLSSASVPVPDYWAYEASSDEMFVCEESLQRLLPGWVKGMHPRGVRSSDVCYLEDPLSVDTRILEMTALGYTDVVVMKHVPGFLVKAYFVSGEMIHWMIPQKIGYSKFGDEVHNDAPCEAWVDEQLLSAIGQRVGETLQLQFYGIDVIVSAPGEIWVIDVNDAPSFSTCRERAALKICSLL